jgi:membrane protein YqaA with SNARE-associated domain
MAVRHCFGWRLLNNLYFPAPPDVLLIALGVGLPTASFLLASNCSIGSVLGGIAVLNIF